MKVKTSEATKLQLDWGVAVVLGVKPKVYCGRVETDQTDENYWAVRREFDHTDPAVCMGLIEQYKLDVVYRAEQWGVEFPHNDQFWSASLAKAVACCVISMKLGDEFECPDELGVV